MAGKSIGKTGRPQKWDRQTVVNRLCERMASEGASLRLVCRTEPGFPDFSTIARWFDEDAELAKQYARARMAALDWRAEDLERIGEDAAAATDPVKVSGLKLQSDNRKWLLAKMAPKKYGERTILEGDEKSPLSITLTLPDARL